MSSYLDFEGVYDPKKMFAVTNWSEEDFTINWKDDTGDNVYNLKAGDVRVYPQYLAYHITKNFVDREMYKIAEKEQDPRNRERLGMAVSNKELRKPYEDKTLKEVKAGEESPEVSAMRAKIRAEIEAENSMKTISNEIHPAPKTVPADMITEEMRTAGVDETTPLLTRAQVVGQVGEKNMPETTLAKEEEFAGLNKATVE